ncbi:MAG: hypothetical protein Q7V31_03705 [Parvibaculum sp.]|uniref:terminase large subunit domain-containing protein n=1 Tax=Parvibaculum sp. TaxID=2024848 RepID=UPI002718B17E|nr:terminase family protein [Parvibaculum sp.]MDO8838008.1 hypothetical protein [Parvibaculum sp.]
MSELAELLLSEELPRGSEIPDDLDPLADGILMKHQREWLEDTSDLKLGEKGRRTGITFAEALDDTLIAATKRSEGGDNVFYIGDTKDKGREFIGYCAHFARIVAKEIVAIEEFMFLDQLEDGKTREIAAYRIRFASGFRIEALSSRPENIRGLQGIVVIDEAAFHKDVRNVLDAVNALLIWGGKIRIISTHNGNKNAFNQLIKATKAGEYDYSLHFIPFSKAVENGLYERVCLVKGTTPTAEGKAEWHNKIIRSYGKRHAARKQELDCVPAEGEGSFLSRVLIESRMEDGIPIIRWHVPTEIAELEPERRRVEVARWCEENLKPLLDALPRNLRHAFGTDIGRTIDGTAIWPFTIDSGLTRRTPFMIELRDAPFGVQQQVLWYVIGRLPLLLCGAIDAGGLGAQIAEATREKFGSVIHEIKFSQEWYRMNMEPFRSAFEDGTIVVPRDADVLADLQAIQVNNGIAKVPDDYKEEGADGYKRHGDSAIAAALAWYASLQKTVKQEFHSTGDGRAADRGFGERGETRPSDRGFGTLPGNLGSMERF